MCEVEILDIHSGGVVEIVKLSWIVMFSRPSGQPSAGPQANDASGPGAVVLLWWRGCGGTMA